MRKYTGKFACAMLAAALGMTGLTGCGSKTLDGTQIVATIDGEEVTLGLASYAMRDQQAQTEVYYSYLMSMYGQSSGGSLDIWDGEAEDGRTYGENAKDDLMESLQKMYVIRAHAEEYGVSLTDEDHTKIEEAVNAFMEANAEETLKELAVSESDLTTYLELRTYQSRMDEPMKEGTDRDVSDEEANMSTVTYVQVSTAGTETDEDGNTIELTDEEKEEKEQLAEDVLFKINEEDDIAGADMDLLASQVDENLSATQISFQTIGDEDSSSLDANVRLSVSGLGDGELYPGVIEGNDGNYYVVRVDQVTNEELTESKRETIISDREQETYDALLQEWVDASKMEINEKVWKQITVTDSKKFTYKAAEAEDTTGEETAGDDADATDDTAAEEEAAGEDEDVAEDDTAGEETAGDADEADDTAEDKTADEDEDAADDAANEDAAE